MKDFYSLRETFQKRLPGLFIPSLPPKTVFSPSESSKIEERSFHLEQFMKKVHKLFYLKESDELAIFARYKKPEEQINAPDMTKKLETMPAQNASMLAFRIKCACQGSEVRYRRSLTRSIETTKHTRPAADGKRDHGRKGFLQRAHQVP